MTDEPRNLPPFPCNQHEAALRLMAAVHQSLDVVVAIAARSNGWQAQVTGGGDPIPNFGVGSFDCESPLQAVAVAVAGWVERRLEYEKERESA